MKSIVVVVLTLLVSGCAARVEGEAQQFTIGEYRRFFDQVHANNASLLKKQAASGDGHTYYTFSYVLEGTLAMYEGTGDLKYLEQVLAWAETMVSKATIVDVNQKRNWAGTWSSEYAARRIATQLEEFQGSTALARLARLVLTEPSLKRRYGTRVQLIHSFVKQDIVDKWIETRAGSESWFRKNAGDESEYYSGKTALLVRLLLDLHRIDCGGAYLGLARDLLDAFKRRLTFLGDAFVFRPGTASAAPDTTHANRHPYMAVDAYEAGVVITRDDLTGLAKLLSGVIWDQSLVSPRFTNYVDGSNALYRRRGPWSAGQIYSGWITLGAYDSRAQLAGEATLRALMSGMKNPSLDYMSTIHGKLNLTGFLARNRAVLERHGRAAPAKRSWS
jgi:hypothetical protein